MIESVDDVCIMMNEVSSSLTMISLFQQQTPPSKRITEMEATSVVKINDLYSIACDLSIQGMRRGLKTCQIKSGKFFLRYLKFIVLSLSQFT